MTGSHDDRDPEMQQVERMKSDFLVAQQRRRDRAAASRLGDDGGGDGPPHAGPVALVRRIGTLRP